MSDRPMTAPKILTPEEVQEIRERASDFSLILDQTEAEHEGAPVGVRFRRDELVGPYRQRLQQVDRELRALCDTADVLRARVLDLEAKVAFLQLELAEAEVGLTELERWGLTRREGLADE